MGKQNQSLLSDLQIKPGKDHLTYYNNYFSSEKILYSYIKKLSSITSELPDDLSITEIGAGTGILGQAIRRWLQSQGKQASLNLVEKDADSLQYNNDQQSEKFVGDNKNNPLPDQSQHLVISRSVIHYEDSIENINKVLSEVERVLKERGFFVDQFITFESKVERDLFSELHERLGRSITLPSAQKYKEILSTHFNVENVYEEVDDLNCVQTSSDVAKRYNLSKGQIKDITRMISDYSDHDFEHFQTSDKEFQWTVPFSVFINKKA